MKGNHGLQAFSEYLSHVVPEHAVGDSASPITPHNLAS